MKLLDQHQALRQQIFDYFGYVEDWVIYPLSDATEHYWKLDSFSVVYGPTEIAAIDEENEDSYKDAIYRDGFLKKWIYRGAEYTMIVVDTHTDGNEFLQIFDNAKEVK